MAKYKVDVKKQVYSPSKWVYFESEDVATKAEKLAEQIKTDNSHLYCCIEDECDEEYIAYISKNIEKMEQELDTLVLKYGITNIE